MAPGEVEWRLAGDEDQMAQKKGGVRIETVEDHRAPGEDGV
jgi:hypothetical protein